MKRLIRAAVLISFLTVSTLNFAEAANIAQATNGDTFGDSIKNNPGKSWSVPVCLLAFIPIFGPALCLAAVAGGIAYDEFVHEPNGGQ